MEGYVYRQISQILEASVGFVSKWKQALLNYRASRDTFKNNLYFAANIVTEGNIANFASLLKIPKNTF